jgi:hypothetical protein
MTHRWPWRYHAVLPGVRWTGLPSLPWLKRVGPIPCVHAVPPDRCTRCLIERRQRAAIAIAEWRAWDARMREGARLAEQAWTDRCEHGVLTYRPCSTCTNLWRGELDRIREAKRLAERMSAALASGNTAELLRLAQ